MKFLHSMIRVKNIEKSLDFYQNVLGLKILDKKTLDDCELYFLAEYEGALEIELTNNFETPENGYENGNCFGHFAFATSNMDDFTSHLKALGYEFLYEPYELKLKAADGNEKIKIEICGYCVSVEVNRHMRIYAFIGSMREMRKQRNTCSF